MYLSGTVIEYLPAMQDFMLHQKTVLFPLKELCIQVL